jgi:hypothetical protein
MTPQAMPTTAMIVIRERKRVLRERTSRQANIHSKRWDDFVLIFIPFAPVDREKSVCS